MIYLYRLFFVPVLLLALPVYVPRMLRRGGYGRHFGQRFGILRGVPLKSPGMRRIWIHAVSVGEILALKPLIARLRDHGQIDIVLTTTTSTAYALARRDFSTDLVFLAHFPLDFWPFSRCAWNTVQPDACVLMEAEIWPEHLHQARLRNVPVFLINARMSERSFDRWRRLPQCVRSVFGLMHRIIAASDEDRRRFVQLGASEDKVVVSGNLKLDFVPAPVLSVQEVEQLRWELGLFDAQGGVAAPLVLAGASTWPGEEEMLLRVLEKLRAQGLPCRLLVVPRHAERRKELRALLSQFPWTVHFRTDGVATGPVDVAVADTTGEMVKLLQAADVVFVGKSMEQNRGGQNPIEAAALEKPVLFGPNMQNFRAVARSMLESKAALLVQDEKAFLTQVLSLLQDSVARKEQGMAARKWHEAGKGATGRTFAVLREALDGSALGKA